MKCDLYTTVIRDFINIFLVIPERNLTFVVKMTENSEKLGIIKRKIESDETVMWQWNIIGINAGAPSTQRRYLWGVALGIYTGGVCPGT